MGLIRVEVMENERSEEWYTRDWVADSDRRRFLPIYRAGLNMLREIAAESKPTKPPVVLEAGCGDGYFGKLVSRKFTWKGFDFCRYAVEKALDRGVDAWVGNVYDSTNYDHNYNVFVAMEVLEHIDDLRLLDNVKTGAQVLCSMPLNEPVIPTKATCHVRWYKDEDYIRERFAGRLTINKFITSWWGNGYTDIMFRGTKL